MQEDRGPARLVGATVCPQVTLLGTWKDQLLPLLPQSLPTWLEDRLPFPPT